MQVIKNENVDELPLAHDDLNKKLITVVHPDDEMYQFFTAHSLHKTHALESYFLSGERMADGIQGILKSAGKTLQDVDGFLEFACGYGRFTRHLVRIFDRKKITVSDVYKEAVDFQINTFDVNGFYSEFNPDDLVIPGRYEVIYVASLFSHLPRKTWQIWLRKLYNALQDDGIIIFSTHGPSCMPDPDGMNSSGFVFRRMSESKTHSFDEYGTTYVTSDFVNNAVKRVTGQSVLLELPKGLWGYQDIYVVKRQILRSMSPFNEDSNEESTIRYKILENNYESLEKDYGLLQKERDDLVHKLENLTNKSGRFRFFTRN